MTEHSVQADQPLPVGVIGVGYLGQHHARLYSRMAGVRLVGVVDTDAERAATVAREARCAVYP
ncbi:MAG TPA: Gfo/Idh/MocA family oxidoreductase, partial [Nitrospiria bacterium]|nr:Gfo/Idh/MocA family oxidoreductase [Nitrospiria bacterium]